MWVKKSPHQNLRGKKWSKITHLRNFKRRGKLQAGRNNFFSTFLYRTFKGAKVLRKPRSQASRFPFRGSTFGKMMQISLSAKSWRSGGGRFPDHEETFVSSWSLMIRGGSTWRFWFSGLYFACPRLLDPYTDMSILTGNWVKLFYLLTYFPLRFSEVSFFAHTFP